MNELNYATLEASQRLFDAGIVLETENYWRIYGVDEDPVIELVTAEHRLDGWDRCNLRTYPAPSMAEVWRELPETDVLMDFVRKYTMATCEGWIVINIQEYVFNLLRNVNRMIDLLIWVTEQKRKER